LESDGRGVAEHHWLVSCWVAKYGHRYTRIYYFMHALAVVALAVRLLLLRALIVIVLLVRAVVVRLLLLLVEGGASL
jgi:hypothetical protein